MNTYEAFEYKVYKDIIKKYSAGTIERDGIQLKDLIDEKKPKHYISTPDYIIDEMISISNVVKESCILVFFSLDIVYRLYECGYTNVTFVSDCKTKINAINKVLKETKETIKTIYYYDEHKKKVNMKFDAIIMNPPYQKGTGSKILKRLYDNKTAKNIVSIQPYSTFTSVTKNGQRLRDSFNFKQIRIKNPFKIWPDEVAFSAALAIFHINYDKSEDIKLVQDPDFDWFNIKESTVKSLELPVFGTHPVMENIWEKCSVEMKDSILKFRDNTIGPNVITHTQIVGNMYNKNGLGNDILWPCYKGSDNLKNINEVKKDINKCLFFKTENEQKNCKEYFFTSFFSLMMAKTKRDFNIYDYMIEYIPAFDFSTPVTNERIQKEFNLTDKEMEFIEDFGKRLNGEDVDWSKYE